MENKHRVLSFVSTFSQAVTPTQDSHQTVCVTWHTLRDNFRQGCKRYVHGLFFFYKLNHFQKTKPNELVVK